MIRTKGEAGSGNIVEAVTHMKTIVSEINHAISLSDKDLKSYSKEINASYDMLLLTKKKKGLPVPNFSAGGIATPADASLMMQLGAESVFVGSGIFKSKDPESTAKAIVQATTFYDDANVVCKVSTGLKKAMDGLDISEIPEDQLLQKRGW